MLFSLQTRNEYFLLQWSIIIVRAKIFVVTDTASPGGVMLVFQNQGFHLTLRCSWDLVFHWGPRCAQYIGHIIVFFVIVSLHVVIMAVGLILSICFLLGGKWRIRSYVYCSKIGLDLWNWLRVREGKWNESWKTVFANA